MQLYGGQPNINYTKYYCFDIWIVYEFYVKFCGNAA